MTSGKVVKGKCSNISEYLAQHSHNKKNYSVLNNNTNVCFLINSKFKYRNLKQILISNVTTEKRGFSGGIVESKLRLVISLPPYNLAFFIVICFFQRVFSVFG